MSDCHTAINRKISLLTTLIQQNYLEILQIVSDQHPNPNTQKHNPKHKQSHNSIMQVIQQQDYYGTQRSNIQQKQSSTERNKNLLIKKFNTMIGMLEKSSDKFGQIMYMYKNQIKEIAKDLTKEREINMKLTKDIEENKKRKESKERNESKEGGRSSSVSQFKTKKGITGIVPKVGSYMMQKRNNILTKNTCNLAKSGQQQQEEEIRPAPKPFCEQCLNRQKQQAIKSRVQLQEKNKWRQLSSKITNLKNQLSRYEQELMDKQRQIARLNEELKRRGEQWNKQQSQEKRKIKTMNTTLRGEKIVLQNQVMGLKKRLQESLEYGEGLQRQNKRLVLEKENLESTIKWQLGTIEDLRNNYSVNMKQQSQVVKRSNQLRQTNQVLMEEISKQQKCLQGFVENLRGVEESYRREMEGLVRKMEGLEEIIEQKNETIVRLKMGRDGQGQGVESRDGNGKGGSDGRSKQKGRCEMVGGKGVMTMKREGNGGWGMIMSRGNSSNNNNNGNNNNRKQNNNSTNTTIATTNNNNNTTGQKFEQNMIKILNKKLAIKECEIQRLKEDNQMLRREIMIYKQMEQGEEEV